MGPCYRPPHHTPPPRPQRLCPAPPVLEAVWPQHPHLCARLCPRSALHPSTELRRPELVGMCVLKLMGAIKLAKREKGWIGSPWLVLRNDPPALAKGCPVGFRPPRRLCSPAHSAEGPRPQGGKGSGAARGGHPGTGVPFSPSLHPALSRRRGLEGCGICPLQTPRAAHTHARP